VTSLHLSGTPVCRPQLVARAWGGWRVFGANRMSSLVRAASRWRPNRERRRRAGLRLAGCGCRSCVGGWRSGTGRHRHLFFGAFVGTECHGDHRKPSCATAPRRSWRIRTASRSVNQAPESSSHRASISPHPFRRVSTALSKPVDDRQESLRHKGFQRRRGRRPLPLHDVHVPGWRATDRASARVPATGMKGSILRMRRWNRSIGCSPSKTSPTISTCR